MKRKNEKVKHTTVVLSSKAQEIKYDLAPVYGLKNILSAGLILFGNLSDSDQKKYIKIANNVLEDDPAFVAKKIASHAGRAAAQKGKHRSSN